MDRGSRRRRSCSRRSRRSCGRERGVEARGYESRGGSHGPQLRRSFSRGNDRGRESKRLPRRSCSRRRHPPCPRGDSRQGARRNCSHRNNSPPRRSDGWPPRQEKSRGGRSHWDECVPVRQNDSVVVNRSPSRSRSRRDSITRIQSHGDSKDQAKASRRSQSRHNIRGVSGVENTGGDEEEEIIWLNQGVDASCASRETLDKRIEEAASECPPAAPKVNAWESSVYRCTRCKTFGCTYRAVQGSEYCCQGCSGHRVVPGGSVPTARGVIPDQDKFHDKREPADTIPSTGNHASREHDAGCAMMDESVLRASWWEEFRIDDAADESVFSLIIPPTNEAACSPAPVVLFLSGDGHVDDRQDFLWGGIDLLTRNSDLRERFFLVAPKPTTGSGVLRYNSKWQWTWAEDPLWALFTEILRRLGPRRIDPAKLYLTGFSLGAAGTWHVAARYGHHFAAIAPMCGGCEWPDNMWPRGGDLNGDVLKRLRSLPIRAYQIDVDPNSKIQQIDMERLSVDAAHSESPLILPGMEKGKKCTVHVHRWRRDNGGATWGLWVAEGPLMDWSAWDDYGGDKHLLWQRAYPSSEWQLAEYFLENTVPEERRWRFDSPPAIVDIKSKISECLNKAAQFPSVDPTKAWQERLREFVTHFFDVLCEACGPRPSFDKVDFTTVIHDGIKASPAHPLHFIIEKVECIHVLTETAQLGYDKIRYSSRSFAIVRNAGGGKNDQRSIREALDPAREEVVKHPLKIKTADGFIQMWIQKTKDKLELAGKLYVLPRTVALKLFRDLVSQGRGIPLALMPQIEGVIVDEWKPLTDTVNRLFEDTDASSGKEWQGVQNRGGNTNPSSGAKGWGNYGKADTGKEWQNFQNRDGNTTSSSGSKGWGNYGKPNTSNEWQGFQNHDANLNSSSGVKGWGKYGKSNTGKEWQGFQNLNGNTNLSGGAKGWADSGKGNTPAAAFMKMLVQVQSRGPPQQF